ncbi:YabP/YqfC family sporulation protein, partial [Dysosmobacter welbionis]
NLYELFLLPIPYHTSSPDASPVTPGSPAAYTGIRAVFRLNQRKGVGAMQQSLGWAALGTGFTFLMTALGAAMVFFFAGEPRPHFQKTLLGFAAGVMT